MASPSILKVYNEKIKEHKRVEEVKRIKENNTANFEQNYRKHLRCENYKICQAPMIFAIRKGTGYFRTYQKAEHTCPYDKKTKITPNQHRKSNKKEVIKTNNKIPGDVGDPTASIEVKVKENEVYKSFEKIIEKLEKKWGLDTEKNTVYITNPIKSGTKREGRFVTVNLDLKSNENGEFIKNILRLRQLNAASIKDKHDGEARFVYGKVSDIKHLKKNKISIILENNYNAVFSNADQKRLGKRNNEFIKNINNLVGDTLLIPVVIHKNKNIKKFHSKYFGYLIPGLETLIWYI
jgi:hypothetical protein